MNLDIMKTLFPEEMKRVADGLCPLCGLPIGKFRDALSVKEFQISWLCQGCQDQVFA